MRRAWIWLVIATSAVTACKSSHEEHHTEVTITKVVGSGSGAAESSGSATARSGAVTPETCPDKNSCDNVAEEFKKSDPKRFAIAEERACNFGEKYSCVEAAYVYDDAKDFAHAAKLAAKGCELKHDEACLASALDYLNGEGVAKDEKQSNVLMTKACDLGNLVACGSLAVDYDSGQDGVTADPEKALAYGLKACGDGHYDPKHVDVVASGCNVAGVAYVQGKGTKLDEAKAIPLFDKACGLYGKLCKNLGIAYRNGLGGLKKDRARAATLFKTSCDAGLQGGCDQLEDMVKKGEAKR